MLFVFMIFGKREALFNQPLNPLPVPLIHKELIFLLASLGPIFLKMSPGRVHLDRWTHDIYSIKHISSEQLRVRQEGDYEIRLAPTAISKEAGSHRYRRHMSCRALPYFESPLIWNCPDLERHYLFKSNTPSVPLPPRLSYRYLQRTRSSPSI